ncbi:phosphodiesterase [Modicisalibacter tunisiensis]|uniref:Phosphodiesterase n=1 Tax=Modicisalibacter tunisiensis TaxID=390637 RepID=A0ABS7WZ37_9GAMM|nr:phosphodiesterase [Modicisalibacter tunisiensis]KXS38660.1 MAG: Icc protein [Halomonadaceae bacterium T82-2]MBZ9538684.1 phosphodiesterase [Modicisalibacter tunisiensis]MBZ9567902.1 phosphodiesterase [Modicisalibacter tunisiensis]
MRLIQVTDCHLHADPEARSRAGVPFRQLEAVLERVRALRPDVLLVTGDVSQDETPASYELAARAFAGVDCPWFWLAGNHDRPQYMAEAHALLDEVDLGDWRLLLLDSRVSGQVHGELGQTQLQELALRLEMDDRPTLLALHHPPVELGSAWMDAIGLLDREAFWQTLAAYAQVRVVLFGHAHQPFAARHAGTGGEIAIYGCPATADQFLPSSPTFAVDEASRPGCRVVDLEGEVMTTWIERVTP